MNPFAGLFRSRKFLLLVMDTVISITLYFVGKYGGQDVFEDIKFLIAALQPVFIAVIWGIAHEDAANVTAISKVEAAQVIAEGPVGLVAKDPGATEVLINPSAEDDQGEHDAPKG